MKIKRINLMIVIAIFTINSYSQKTNELRVYYGTSYAEFLQNKSLVGSGGYDLKNFNEFGIKYLRQLSTNFYIETGINYSKSDLQITPSFTGETIQSRYEKLEVISVPIYANYTFWKYLFVNGGSILDFQTSDNSTDSQSGIGYGLGIGGKYNFDKFLIFINPNFKKHSIIPFKKKNHHQKLTQLGVQFGIGFKF